MAYVAVNNKGVEYIFDVRPNRDNHGNWFFEYYDFRDTGVKLPKGSITKLIGRTLTWDDGPVELKRDMKKTILPTFYKVKNLR